MQAQREYASRDRDCDEVLEYAQKLVSSPDQTDGLFWPPDVNGEISPLGPLVAYAQGEGYSRKTSATGSGPRLAGTSSVSSEPSGSHCSIRLSGATVF